MFRWLSSDCTGQLFGRGRHAHVLIFDSIDDDEWEVKHHKPAPSP